MPFIDIIDSVQIIQCILKSECKMYMYQQLTRNACQIRGNFDKIRLYIHRKVIVNFNDWHAHVHWVSVNLSFLSVSQCVASFKSTFQLFYTNWEQDKLVSSFLGQSKPLINTYLFFSDRASAA